MDAPIHDHAAGAGGSALRVRAQAVASRRGFRSALRLGLIGAYSIVFMWGGFFDWAGWAETVLWSVGAVLWVVIAVILVREVRRADHRLRYLALNPSLVLLLVAPAFLWLTWMPLVAFVLVVVAYVLDLRHHSAGDGFLFSFGLVLFVGVFAGLSMVEVEYEEPESTLDTPSDAIFWAFASLLRINYGKAFSPVTQEGRLLATVVGVCAVLCASLFTAQVVKWLVGEKKQDDRHDDAMEEAMEAAEEGAGERHDAVLAELAAIRAELAALRDRVDTAVEPVAPPPPGGTLAP